jgi:CheY-like chemotaxis protein
MQNSYALIADPDVVAAHVYLSSVRELGLATAVVRDGTVALSTMLERGAPALLICELALPGLDGFELIEGLRRTVPEKKTPVIAVSSDRHLRARATTMRARLGIGAIMARAASEDSVKRVIRRMLGIGEDTSSRPKPGPNSPQPASAEAGKPERRPPSLTALPVRGPGRDP